MKYFFWNNEKEIEKSFDNDEWKPVDDKEKLKSLYSEYARNTFRKNKKINIRISEGDLVKLKANHSRRAFLTKHRYPVSYINMLPAN